MIGPLPGPEVSDADLAEALAAVLGELIAIPSPFPPGDSREICAYATARLERAGYAVHLASRTPGIDNVVARLGSGKPSLVFNAHVDTVGVGDAAEWRSDPFRAERRDGQVVGLGAGNCKGSMAVQLWLAERIAAAGGPRQGEVVFTFVGDEENLGPDGMYFLRQAGLVRPDMLVLGAQTDNHLIVAERGVLWATITARGKAAHAGNPAAGDSAILRMLRLLQGLQSTLAPRLAARSDGPMQSTMNIGLLHGGHNTNVVASHCMAEIDRRLLPSERVEDGFAEIRDILEAVGEPAGSWGLQLARGTNGFRSDSGGPLVRAFAEAIGRRLGAPARFLNATGVSDGRYFADDGIPILNFGPGASTQGHAANESVPVADLVAAARIQWQVVQTLLGLPG